MLNVGMAVAAVLLAQQTGAAPQEPGLKLTLAADKAEYIIGEEVEAEVTLSNGGEKDLDVGELTFEERRDYAVQVTEKPNGMRDAIFTDLRRHFSEEQIVELTVRTALCGFFNRVNDSMQIGIEDGVVEDMLAHGVSEETLPEAVK